MQARIFDESQTSVAEATADEISTQGVAATLTHEALITTIPEFRSGAWRLLSYRVTETRRPRHAQLLFCRVAYRDLADGRTRITRIVAKVYGRSQGLAAYDAMKGLWEEGFRSPAEHRVPRPYGYATRGQILLQGAAPGVQLSDLFGDDEAALGEGAGRAAAWLLRLQRSGVTGEPKSWKDDACRTRALGKELIAIAPAHARRLGSLYEWLMERLYSEAPPAVPSHGDFHPTNLFLTPGATTAIDFDAFGLREPAHDVGCCLGQLMTTSWLVTGSPDAGWRATTAFWQRYQAGAGVAPWPRVAAHAARTFLENLHHELCVLRSGRVELLDLWTRLIEHCLKVRCPDR